LKKGRSAAAVAAALWTKGKGLQNGRCPLLEVAVRGGLPFNVGAACRARGGKIEIVVAELDFHGAIALQDEINEGIAFVFIGFMNIAICRTVRSIYIQPVFRINDRFNNTPHSR